MSKDKRTKTIQADKFKIVNFEIAIPDWIPDKLAVDYAKICFMRDNGQWLGDIWLEANGETKKTYLMILMKRAGIVKKVKG